jgi:ABC-type transport system substrate-binding protein
MYHSDATTKTVTAQRYAYGNPEVDKLLSQQQQTFDQQARLPILRRAQELIWKDQPLVYLMHQGIVWGQRKNVSGFRLLSGGSVAPGAVQKS